MSCMIQNFRFFHVSNLSFEAIDFSAHVSGVNDVSPPFPAAAAAPSQAVRSPRSAVMTAGRGAAGRGGEG